jgi:hypothetical protein
VNSENGISAYVARNYARLDGLSVWLVDRRSGRTMAAEPVEFTMSEVIEQGVERAPSFVLDEGTARALLDALAAHFGGTSEVQTLRRDYLAERKRVDRFIDHLTNRRPD